jgi:hypothetical protein
MLVIPMKQKRRYEKDLNNPSFGNQIIGKRNRFHTTRKHYTQRNGNKDIAKKMYYGLCRKPYQYPPVPELQGIIIGGQLTPDFNSNLPVTQEFHGSC